MKISYNWLQDYVILEHSAHRVAEDLTNIGLAVDTIESYNDDFILDFDLTSNRSDALSHIGIAREIAVLYGQQLKLPNVNSLEISTEINSFTSVKIENLELCPRYTAKIISGVKLGSSPQWLVDRLASLNQRSINNIVDITNFVLLEFGLPLHAFDFDKLGEKRIVVRTAKKGEQLTTLDGIIRHLSPEMLVIADAKNPIALAGIMGGFESEISEKTVNVLLESAYFESSQIRHTSSALDLHTEASHRFERGVDPEALSLVLDRCAQLIQQVAGGKIVSGRIDVGAVQLSQIPITLRKNRIEKLIGVNVDSSEVEKILTRLGFGLVNITSEEEWKVTVPSYRHDIFIEEDLIEEVIRIIGYNSIPTTLPTWNESGGYLVGEDKRRKIRQVLTGQYFYETISFSWVDEKLLEILCENSSLILSNPIDKTQDRLRPTLLSGLLNSLDYNIKQGIANVRLFEVGKVFSGTLDSIVENERLGLIIMGDCYADEWNLPLYEESFYSLKGIVENVLKSLDAGPCKFIETDKDASTAFFLGQVAEIFTREYKIGILGRCSSALTAYYKFKQPVYMAELYLDNIISLGKSFGLCKPLPKFPSSDRDISILVEKRVTFEEITNKILSLNFKELNSIKLKEVFTGKQIPSDKHALTLNLYYRLEDRTLTDIEVNSRQLAIISLLEDELAAQIR